MPFAGTRALQASYPAASDRLVGRGFGDPAVEAVVAVALVANKASCRVLEKAGLRRGPEFALPGFDSPAARYGLTRAEFRGG